MVCLKQIVYYLWILAACFVLINGQSSGDISALEYDEFDGKDNMDAVFQEAITKILMPFNNIFIPFLPTLSFSPGPNVNVALSFTNITLKGVTVFDLFERSYRRKTGQLNLGINIGNVILAADEYSAGGSINNLPFTGESYFRASFEGIKIYLGMNCTTFKIVRKEICVAEKSTSYEVEITKPSITFDNLNPGTDQGLLINTLLESFVPDIIDLITIGLNSKWFDSIDNLVVSTINKLACPYVY